MGLSPYRAHQPPPNPQLEKVFRETKGKLSDAQVS